MQAELTPMVIAAPVVPLAEPVAGVAVSQAQPLAVPVGVTLKATDVLGRLDVAVTVTAVGVGVVGPWV
jgi:hypothetical protein